MKLSLYCVRVFVTDWERARYFGLEKELAQALDETEQA